MLCYSKNKKKKFETLLHLGGFSIETNVTLQMPHATELPLAWPSNALLAYLLTPWCRILLEKKTGLQLVKKFPLFHGNRRLIKFFSYVF